MRVLHSVLILSALFIASGAFAGDKATQPATETTPATAPTAQAIDEINQKWMVEGQKRYLTNCGRCHQSPHMFSSREMAMVVRHMRVRAMLTEEDMDYLLYYMTHQ